MSATAKSTMTPEEVAAWHRDMENAPALDPNRFAEKAAEQRKPSWRTEYDRLYRAGEQMALVLEGLLAWRVSRKEVTDALHAFRQLARTGGE